MMDYLKRLFGSLRERKSGFTLVELLIVVAIIVALGAVIVPNVLQFANRGDQGALSAEGDAVQAAMDAMMADQNPPITGVTARANPDLSTNTWTALPAEGSLDAYLREATSNYFYCWNATGLITQQDTVATACP